MNGIPQRRTTRVFLIALVLAAFAAVYAPAPVRAEPWSFGIMADTQWVGADDGLNPNSVAVDFINQANREFIARGVKFVVALGDLADRSHDPVVAELALDTRATYTQALYNAGIGFFPLRGNHDQSAQAAKEFLRLFPQTRGHKQNATPDNAFLSTRDDVATNPIPRQGAPFHMGEEFSSPAKRMKGLSYAFTYRNATFVLLDQFTPAKGDAMPVASQQPWIDRVLERRPAGSHAFVFSHKGLTTPMHADGLFGHTPATAPRDRDIFIRHLRKRGVRLLFCGHDHLYDRSEVWTTDGAKARLTQVVCAGGSSKFYLPAIPENDERFNLPAFGKRLRTPLSQELGVMGFTIVTLDGPTVTVDVYSAAVNPAIDEAKRVASITTTPPLRFTWRERFGSSPGGREFIVGPGQPYSAVQDRGARILGGSNASPGKDGNGQPFSKAVNTAWSDAPSGAAGRALTLFGMAKGLGSHETDLYALGMDCTAPAGACSEAGWGIASRDASGNWARAVDANTGGTARFVRGPWQPEYGLGTYGYDTERNMAWAVLNHQGDFAVMKLPGN